MVNKLIIYFEVWTDNKVKHDNKPAANLHSVDVIILVYLRPLSQLSYVQSIIIFFHITVIKEQKFLFS